MPTLNTYEIDLKLRKKQSFQSFSKEAYIKYLLNRPKNYEKNGH
jgi:hypothetical protein